MCCSLYISLTSLEEKYRNCIYVSGNFKTESLKEEKRFYFSKI